MKKKKRRINLQKIFSFASFIFILVCVLWYGGRFIHFYQESKKVITNESTNFASLIKTNNQEKETFQLNKNTYYFYGQPDNNYVEYSNMIWRILKINEDDTVVLVSDSIVATLPFGIEESTYANSSILNWLNQSAEDDTFSLEYQLNQKDNLLIKSSICTDTIDDLEKLSCKEINQDYYLGLLSIEDCIRTGGKTSFLNNGKYSYLANQNKDKNVWYLNPDGQLDTTEKEEFLGVKTILTLSSTLD